MDNKRLKQILLFLMLAIIVFSIFIIKKEYVTSDEKKFKREFEYFNNKTSLRFSEKYPSVKVEKQNGIKYVSGNEVVDIMENGTGIIFLAYPEGIRSRILLQDFLNVCYHEKVKTIYYFNAYSSRDEKEKKDDTVVTIKEGSKNYQKILKLLGERAQSYQEVNDGSKRIYFPTILIVKNGKLLYSYQASSEEESSFDKVTKKQKQALKKELRENIKKIIKNE